MRVILSFDDVMMNPPDQAIPLILDTHSPYDLPHRSPALCHSLLALWTLIMIMLTDMGGNLAPHVNRNSGHRSDLFSRPNFRSLAPTAHHLQAIRDISGIFEMLKTYGSDNGRVLGERAEKGRREKKCKRCFMKNGHVSLSLLLVRGKEGGGRGVVKRRCKNERSEIETRRKDDSC